MNRVDRLIELLNLFNIGITVQIDSNAYAMTSEDYLGLCEWKNNKPTDDIIIKHFTYKELLEIPFSGLKELCNVDMFDTISLFTDPLNIPAYCVTTNGDVKADGSAVMGRGVALQVVQEFPGIDKTLGSFINQYGNRVFNLGIYEINDNSHKHLVRIISFPTKHHWKETADITLIVKSCQELIEVCNKFNVKTCFLPAPGVGLESLNYKATVKPSLEVLLDERFYVCFKDS